MDYLGIDLSKQTFDATVHTATGAQHYRAFPNTPDGFAQLDAWMRDLGVTRLHACMEATNVYWEALAAWLHGHGHTVSVVNPARIKGSAQAMMQRNKTDKLDSAVIAAFCATQQPTAWEPMTKEQHELRALVRHRDDLLQSILHHENRVRDTTNAFVQRSLATVVTALKTQLGAVDQTIRDHVTAHHTLQTNLQLVTSIVGISVVTGTKLLAEFAAHDQYASAKAVAADAGVTPSQYQSGTSVRRRPQMSKQGKASIRAALWWPAITAMQHCPAIRAFAARLAARGKAKKVIIGAVMRKLIHIVYGVLKHQTPYDPAKVMNTAGETT